jgi:4-hydroxy-3-polyprenylbenzoate decarboxylase
MAYKSLREFLSFLESQRKLVRVTQPVSTVLEMTEIGTRLIAHNGPAALFENAIKADGTKSTMPVLTNLFGTVERVAMGVTMGGKDRRTARDLREVGELLAFLREPTPPAGLKDALALLPLAGTVMQMRPKRLSGKGFGKAP